MHSAKKGFWAVLMLVPLMLGGSVFSNGPASVLNPAVEAVEDDEVPDETARVARISFIQGDVKIRRAEMEDWEKASQNLPIVEGDEIATDANARLEIQFNSSTFVRVGGNSYVKVVGLKDEGIAVSLPQGTMSVRIHDFEGDKTYFEIDAPKTTVAVQKAGVYRVDSGQKDSPEIRVSVTEEGEARVYTESSGFALKSGRIAKIFIDGINAGETDMADASLFRDDFDSWTADRDAAVAKSLKDAYYGKYYDRDIYGAEDLNDFGEWIHTPDYGYVWRPYQSAVNVYADWSPYRYGHWRWIPPYGWTWVNDEPWGWATYHHGRWFYLNGRWCWSPYGYYRGRRSWWRPALVAITIVNNNVCWWPLSYHHRYRNYNRHHRRDRNNHPQPGPSPTPTRTPDRQDGPLEPIRQREKIRVPASGVIMAESGDIETGRRRYRTPDVRVATTILSQDSELPTSSGPVLPAPDRQNGPINGDTRVEAPRIIRRDPSVKMGAGERADGGPLDDVLRRTRIYGNRTPRPTGADTTVINGEPRRTDTGAVGRPPVTPRIDGPAGPTPERRDVPRERRRERPAEPEPPQTPPIIAPRQPETRSKQPEPRPRREDAPVEQPQPRYEPPKERSEPKREERYEPPPRREEPRNDTPAPRPDPPQRSEPKPDPPKRDDPPAKSEPSRPSPSERKGKPR